ncbi:MAG: ABC transporter permease [Phycisphaerales bacterium]
MRLPRNTVNYAIMVALLVVLGAFLLYPIGLTLRGAFYESAAKGSGFTLLNLRLVFEDPILREGLLNSFKIACCTTFLATLIALPLAVLAARFTFPGKALFSAIVLVPLILPPFVGAIGLKLMLGRRGALNALLGTEIDFFQGELLGQWFADNVVSTRLLLVACVQALCLYPIIYLNATAALANLDPALDEAAENLGAGFWRRFFRITLPLIRPGLFAGGTIGFIWSFTELGTPLAFDYARVTPVQIFNGLKGVETSAEPYVLTFIMLVAAISMYALGKLVLGGKAYEMYAKASRAGGDIRLTGIAGWAAAAAFALVSALALLPHIGVILTSIARPGSWYESVLPAAFTLDHFGQALGSDLASSSINNSLLLAGCAVVIDLVLGILVGYIIVRTTIRGRALLDALCMLPLAVPGLVMAFGYVAMSLRYPFGKGDPLEGVVSVVGATPNPVPLLIIAYAIRRLPYIVRATVAGLQQTSGQLEEAAMNLGATRFTAVRRVIVPLIAANLIAGALLAFSFAMLEVSDSLLLAQQETHYPITKAIFAFSNRLADGPSIASAMGVWGMMLLATTLVGASVLMGRKLGAIFRV